MCDRLQAREAVVRDQFAAHGYSLASANLMNPTYWGPAGTRTLDYIFVHHTALARYSNLKVLSLPPNLPNETFPSDHGGMVLKGLLFCHAQVQQDPYVRIPRLPKYLCNLVVATLSTWMLHC